MGLKCEFEEEEIVQKAMIYIQVSIREKCKSFYENKRKELCN